MIDVTPPDSDSMRELRRIGPIAQALFTVAFAVAACVLALVLMGSTAAPAPAPTPAPALDPTPMLLTAAPQRAPVSVPRPMPTPASDQVLVPSAISSTDVLPEPVPPAY